jgi:exodeoxyribonuclease VII large subunit
VTETAAAPRIYPVGAVVAGVRRLLEERVGSIWVVGEVSNLRRPSSGHLYFTLKDAEGQLRAALFRGSARRLAFEPEDGLEVLVYGQITVYGERGELQIVVRELEPRGTGALQLAFDQLRRRLESEGLFAGERKRALPRVPRRIGVATSASGAALRDVLEVARRRLPGLPLRLASCRVQGLGAEHSVADALELLARHGDVDLILLVRGGGTLEDLQPFNSESLARAIAQCRVPVVAGIGHEVDVTIACLVADARAPTPSAAAELAIPDARALAAALARSRDHLMRAMRTALGQQRAAWLAGDTALRAHAPAQRIALGRERLDAARRGLARAMSGELERRRARLGHSAVALDSLSPLAVLGRGYGLVRRARDGAIVRDAADAPPGESLDVRVARAELEVRVVKSIGRVDP